MDCVNVFSRQRHKTLRLSFLLLKLTLSFSGSFLFLVLLRLFFVSPGVFSVFLGFNTFLLLDYLCFSFLSTLFPFHVCSWLESVCFGVAVLVRASSLHSLERGVVQCSMPLRFHKLAIF